MMIEVLIKCVTLATWQQQKYFYNYSEFIKYCWITEHPNAVIRELINKFYARV